MALPKSTYCAYVCVYGHAKIEVDELLEFSSTLILIKEFFVITISTKMEWEEAKCKRMNRKFGKK